MNRPSSRSIPARTGILHRKSLPTSESRLKPSSERGALLLYVTLVVAVLSVAAATVMPVVGSVIDEDLEKDSSKAMSTLRTAIRKYFEDTQQFPTSMFDLVRRPDGVENWQGGYIRKRATDFKSKSLSLAVDAWKSPFVVIEVDPWTRKLVSFGANGVDDKGAGDDVCFNFSVHSVVWRMTKEELEDINKAIAAYNVIEETPMMSAPWPSILATLETAGYLDPGEAPEYDYMHDGWGQTYLPVGDPVTAATTAGQPAP